MGLFLLLEGAQALDGEPGEGWAGAGEAGGRAYRSWTWGASAEPGGAGRRTLALGAFQGIMVTV